MVRSLARALGVCIGLSSVASSVAAEEKPRWELSLGGGLSMPSTEYVRDWEDGWIVSGRLGHYVHQSISLGLEYEYSGAHRGRQYVAFDRSPNPVRIESRMHEIAFFGQFISPEKPVSPYVRVELGSFLESSSALGQANSSTLRATWGSGVGAGLQLWAGAYGFFLDGVLHLLFEPRGTEAQPVFQAGFLISG